MYSTGHYVWHIESSRHVLALELSDHSGTFPPEEKPLSSQALKQRSQAAVWGLDTPAPPQSNSFWGTFRMALLGPFPRLIISFFVFLQWTLPGQLLLDPFRMASLYFLIGEVLVCDGRTPSGQMSVALLWLV